MKLSVFTVVTPDLSPEELVQAAKAAGLDGIEWRYKDIPADAKEEKPSFWRNNRCSIDPQASDEELERFRRLTIDNGLEVAALVPYLNACSLEETKDAFRAASMLGASMMRIGVPGYNKSVPYPILLEQAISYLRQVEPIARETGIKGLVETHHYTIAPSAGLAYRLVQDLDPDCIGVLFDPGNMVHEGYERFRMGLELLGPYLAHVHIKNAAWVPNGLRPDGTKAWSSHWAGLQEGAVDFKELIEDLKSVGYKGYLGIEDFSGQFESRELLQIFAKQMRMLL